MYKAYEFFTSAPKKIWNWLLGREDIDSQKAVFLNTIDELDHKSMMRWLDDVETQIVMNRIRSKAQADPTVLIGKTKHKVSKLRIAWMENLTGYIAMNEKFITWPELSNRKVRAISRRVHEIVYSKSPSDIKLFLTHHTPRYTDESTKNPKLKAKEQFSKSIKGIIGKLQLELIIIDNPSQASKRPGPHFIDNGYWDSMVEEMQALIALKVIQEQSRVMSRKKLSGEALSLRETAENCVLEHINKKIDNREITL